MEERLVKITHCIYTCFEEIAYQGAFEKIAHIARVMLGDPSA